MLLLQIVYGLLLELGGAYQWKRFHSKLHFFTISLKHEQISLYVLHITSSKKGSFIAWRTHPAACRLCGRVDIMVNASSSRSRSPSGSRSYRSCSPMVSLLSLSLSSSSRSSSMYSILTNAKAARVQLKMASVLCMPLHGIACVRCNAFKRNPDPVLSSAN